MDPLELLHAKISGFPAYGDEVDRRRSDELVRSYLGEALAEMVARLSPLQPDLLRRVDELLVRLAFAHQAAFSTAGGAPASAVSDDAVLLELADRAAALDAAAVPAYLGDVVTALDRRDAAMVAAAAG